MALTQIKAGAIADDAIDSSTYIDGSIDNAHLADDAVDSDQYVDGSIDLVHMSADSVDSDQYVDGSIDNAHLAANSVDSDQYVDGSIDNAHLADDAVDSDELAAGSVDIAHLAAGTDGKIITWDANGAATVVGPGTDGQVLTSTGAGSPPAFETISTTDTLSFRNLIINGAMQVAQRGTSSTGDGYATVDRFAKYLSNGDEAPTQAQHALTSSDTGPWEKGLRYSYHMTNGDQTSGAGAADRFSLAYNLEDQDLASSGWDYTSESSYVTLSYWVKSSVAQNFYGRLYVYSGDAYSWETGSLSANTWTKVTKTIPGNSNLAFDNDNTPGLYIVFSVYSGTDNTDPSNSLNTWAAWDAGNRFPTFPTTWYTTDEATFEITGVQLEVGSVATPFEHRSYGDELQRCMRYYWKCGGDNGDSIGIPGAAWADTYFTYIIMHPVPMRATPTYVGYNDCRFQAQNDSASYDASGMAILNTTVDGKTICIAKSGSSGATAGQAGTLQSQEDGMYISFSAEL